MRESETHLHNLVEGLEQMRDQIKLKVHLASMETRDEWEKVDARYQELKQSLKPVKDAASESSSDVVDALKLTAEEVKGGLEKIWKAL